MNGLRTAFCDAFLDAVYERAPSGTTLADLAHQPGFVVYRNTIFKACVDALAANFPTVERLTGTPWFRSAAAEYARATPPETVSLLEYGAGFPAFLASLPSTRTLPYLAQVAQLDRLWLACHTAPDDEPLAPAALAQVAPEELGRIVLRPHPSARWMWEPSQPVVSIWKAHREDAARAAAPAWQAEGVLLTRREGAVTTIAIGPGSAALLEACAAGQPLSDAAGAALAAEATLDIANALATLLAADAFVTLSPSGALPC